MKQFQTSGGDLSRLLCHYNLTSLYIPFRYPVMDMSSVQNAFCLLNSTHISQELFAEVDGAKIAQLVSRYDAFDLKMKCEFSLVDWGSEVFSLLQKRIIIYTVL